MKAEVEKVGVVNGVELTAFKNGNTMIAIKPICQALGIDFDSQRKKLKGDDFFNSTAVLSTAVGADGKGREMLTLPIMHTLGWLFTINPKNVSEEARPIVLAYREECIKALWFWFVGRKQFLEEKDAALESAMAEEKELKRQFSQLKELLKMASKHVQDIRGWDFDEWRGNNNQLNLGF